MASATELAVCGSFFLTGKVLAYEEPSCKHLTNISYRNGKVLSWDLQLFAERVIYSLMSTVIELTPSGDAFHLEVAQRLRIGLEARGIKKGDVAAAIGMTPASFSKRLHGHLVIDLDEIHQIAAATGINRDWLLTGTGPMLDPDGGNGARPEVFETPTF